MRDYSMECLGSELAKMDAYEAKCPVCDACGCHMTADEYVYDINGDLICEDCIISYVKDNFRHRLSEYMEGR